uniref:Uncharacterized protein n=1 Tax=Glossina pallidipes TaxID=7398 RepID=A0A1A9ZN71_GLOPL
MYRWSSLPKDMDSYCANRYRSPCGYGRATNVYSGAPPHPKSQRQCAGLSNSWVENNANKNVCKQIEFEWTQTIEISGTHSLCMLKKENHMFSVYSHKR